MPCYVKVANKTIVYYLKQYHSYDLVRDHDFKESAMGLKSLSVNKKDVVFFNIESEGKEEGCKTGHNWHRYDDKKTQKGHSQSVGLVIAKVEEPIIL